MPARLSRPYKQQDRGGGRPGSRDQRTPRRGQRVAGRPPAAITAPVLTTERGTTPFFQTGVDYMPKRICMNTQEPVQLQVHEVKINATR